MAILYVIFFFAGASSLAYQIIWIRLFGLIFGGTEVSMSVVVAVFMGGLALGSYVIGNYAVTSKNRVRLFGYLEIALGLLAILVFFGISRFAPIIYSLPFNDIHSFAGIAVRIFLSALLLILPTMIMGGTLPVLVRAVTERKDRIMANTSLLYSVNALGAMFGAFIVGFVLIRYFGILRSNLIAATIEIMVGITALAISGGYESSSDVLTGDDKKAAPVIPEKGWRFIIAIGLTGFIGLILEMVWLRMLLLVVNNTIYLYTIVITFYLLGLGTGGYFLRVFIPKKRRTERAFGFILAGTGLTIILGFIFYPIIVDVGFHTSPAFFSTFARLSVLTVALFCFLGFIPVFLMGLSFPLGLGLYAKEIRGLSGRIGVIYSFNTIGSLVGSLIAVFVLIPTIGMKYTVLLSAVIIVIPAIYFLRKEQTVHHRFPASGVTIGAFAVLTIIALQIDFPGVMLRKLINSGEFVEYSKEGASSTIWITNGDRFYRKIWINNLWVASTAQGAVHHLTAHYSLILHKNPKVACGIAFGTGQTFGTCLLFPLEKLVCVEIDKEVIKAARGRFDNLNYGVLESPRSEIVIDDGRFYLDGTKETFDIITAEPLQPYTRGTVNLYTEEFYKSCKKALNPGGIVAQWIPFYNSGVADVWSMIRTFVEVFEYAHLFTTEDDGIIIGSNEPITVDPNRELPLKAANDLRKIKYADIYAIMGNYICSREKLLEASRNYPITTDDRPTLEFTAPITHWNEDRNAPVGVRRQLLTLLEPVDRLYTGNADYERGRKFQKSRTMANQAYVLEKTGRIDEAHVLYEQAFLYNKSDVKAARELFIFLRKFNRLNRIPEELKAIVTGKTNPFEQETK
ncbi:fused MFS/spermidine synthase [Candidatus Latescibacterota bacterium]